jgi:pilus assembly protein Flp/PilA
MANLFYLINRMRDERGQGLVEYALILVLVSIASITLLTALGTDVAAVFEDVSTELGAGT